MTLKPALALTLALLGFAVIAPMQQADAAEAVIDVGRERQCFDLTSIDVFRRWKPISILAGSSWAYSGGDLSCPIAWHNS